ncbi:hypothetical protein QUB68_28345, partial [Microcoleus sp. A006_D1]|uniref:hypothetical protein n=1 Tax=Microcoleus sp. A006_D1 TaxID=3055267 RepID=UPI002FD423C2
MVFAVDVRSSITMSRTEAEEITSAIQQNFDSLGLMLETARNRKAWKALDYKNFGSYCDNEFGKSQSRAYQLIEESKIAQTLIEEGGRDLRLPVSSNLRLLKDLPVEQQIEAIKYSEELASAADQKKPNKNHLLFAINKVSGTHSTEDLKSSLEALGFAKGVEVATIRGVNIGSRGFIRKLDKKGQLYVELHSGGRTPIPYDATSLRILSASEKPEKAASFDSTNIGDKVLIFSPGLDGILGTIQTRLNDDKMVGIKVNGNLLKLPYAELEVVEFEVDEPEQESWLQNFVWTDFGVQWCYESESQTIAAVYQDLKLHPTEKGKGSPADWVRRWVRNNALNLAVELLPEEQLSILITTRLITCGSEEEKGNLAESLIAEIWKMSLPSECREKVKSLISDKADKAKGISFALTLHELLNGEKTQTRRAWQDDYARSFIRYYEKGIEIPALNKGQHRGGQKVGKIRLTEKPYQQMLSEMPVSDLDKEGGMCATVQEFIDRFFEGQDKLVWVLDFEFIASEPDSEVALLKQRLEEAEQVISQFIKCQQTSVIEVDTVDTHESLQQEIDATANAFDWGDIGYPDSQGQIVKYDDWTEHNTSAVQPLDAPETSDFLVENNTSTASDADTAAHTDLLVENTATTASPLDSHKDTKFLAKGSTETSKIPKYNYRLCLQDGENTLWYDGQNFIFAEYDAKSYCKKGICSAKYQLRLHPHVKRVLRECGNTLQIVEKFPAVTITHTNFLVENTATTASDADAEESPGFLVANTATTASDADTAAHTDFLVENNTSPVQPLDAPETSEFLVENNAATASDADTAAHTDFLVENNTSPVQPL